MEKEYGSVTILCRKCRAVSVIDDAGSIEHMKGHTCPSCGSAMSGRELALLKGMYYLKLSRGIQNNPFGMLHRGFDCKINLGIHYKK